MAAARIFSEGHVRHVRPTVRQRDGVAAALVSHLGDARGSFYPHHGRGSAHAHIGATRDVVLRPSRCAGPAPVHPLTHRWKSSTTRLSEGDLPCTLVGTTGRRLARRVQDGAREPTEDTCCLSRNDLAAEQKTTGAGTWSRRTACLRARRQRRRRRKPPLRQSPCPNRRPVSEPRRLLRRRVVSSAPFRLPVQGRRVSSSRPSPMKR